MSPAMTPATTTGGPIPALPPDATPMDPVPCADGSARAGHPLELIPLFRRWPRSFLRDVVYTLIWNTMFAVAFTGFALIFDSRVSVLHILWVNFVFAQCLGTVTYGGFLLGDRIRPDIHRQGLAIRTVYYAGVSIVGVFLGYIIAGAILGTGGLQTWLFTARGAGTVLVLSFIITGILLLIFVPRERAARAEANVAREQARVAAAEREAKIAQLKLLEAQVEPHFLYNTLAHVVSMIDSEPATAKRMLDCLIALLRATATAASRTATLRGQIDLLRAYLEIFELRMGRRLAYAIDVPADLAALVVPPMLLQPLVENAIRHGLEPKIDGGRIDVTARRESGRLVLTVADTGLGFAATRRVAAPGTGLANLRARLAASYGAAATLAIEDNAGGGTRITMTVPTDE